MGELIIEKRVAFIIERQMGLMIMITTITVRVHDNYDYYCKSEW